MSQNRSPAVMAQRSEPHDSLDDFPTPPWATRALIEHIIIPHVMSRDELRNIPVWQPDCNRGYMARPLIEYHNSVYCTDINDYGWSGQHAVQDFLWPDPETETGVRAIYSNPPFRLGEQFIQRALDMRNLRFAAFIVRTSFIEGIGRYERVYSKNPPTFVCPFVERVAMFKGRYDAKGASATSYSWLVWANGMHIDDVWRLIWIPPCKKDFYREDDIYVD